MAETIVRILSLDEKATVDALKSIETAMRSVQATASRTATITKNIIPVEPIKKAQTAMVSAGAPLSVLSSGLRVAGVESQALSFGFQAAAVSASVLKGGVVGLTAAVKGLMASLGPVGWTIIAISVAIAAISAAIEIFTGNLEKQKKALEESNKSLGEWAKRAEEIAVRRLRRAGKEEEANILSVRNRANAEIEKLDIEFNASERSELETKLHKVKVKTIEKDAEEEIQEIMKKATADRLKIQKERYKKEADEFAKAQAQKIAAIEAAQDKQADAEDQLDRANKARFEEDKKRYKDEANLEAKAQETKNKLREDGEDKIAEGEDRLEKANKEAGDAEAREQDKLVAQIQADGERELKIKEDAADAQNKIDEIQASRRLKIFSDADKILREQLDAARKESPEFKAQFVGLQQLGRDIQAAAVSKGPSNEVVAIQKKIEENQKLQVKEQEKQAKDALEIQNKQLLALEKIAKGTTAVLG